MKNVFPICHMWFFVPSRSIEGTIILFIEIMAIFASIYAFEWKNRNHFLVYFDLLRPNIGLFISRYPTLSIIWSNFLSHSFIITEHVNTHTSSGFMNYSTLNNGHNQEELCFQFNNQQTCAFDKHDSLNHGRCVF